MSQLTNRINRTVRAGVNSLLTDLITWNRDKLAEAKVKWYHEYMPTSDFVAADISGLGLDLAEKLELSKIVDDPNGTPPQPLHLDEEGFDYPAYQREIDEKQEQIKQEILERYRLVVSVTED